MNKNDMISLRREKLRNLLQQEMERYQYEVYSNNGSQYLLDKFNAFNNYINGNKPSEMNMNYNDLQYQYQNQNQNNNININNVNNQNEYQSEPNQQVNNNNNNYNYYQNKGGYSNGNNMGNYNYGNLDIDEQINNYSDHYNKLRMDEFMSKKSIQDDLLNKINQKLIKINKDIDDKVYQEHLAAQWKQNHQNP